MRLKYLRLWIALFMIGLIGAVTVGVELRAVHSERLVDKVSSGIRRPVYDDPGELVPVGFACRTEEPTDDLVRAMVDEAIAEVLGPRGLAAIVKLGDRVVIKVNNVGPYLGRKGEKGRGVITDPRIVRYVAEKVRAIIGFEGTADLKVVDAVFYADANPSLKTDKKSFYWARLERTGDDRVDPEDVCYDGDADGILDGGSQARLVNLDAIDADHRILTRVRVAGSKELTVCLPEFLRTREEANGKGDYCDVLIGLPIFKSHGYAGVTGALKLHYGFRPPLNMQGDSGRFSHSGLYWDFTGMHNKDRLYNYLCAEHLVRSYDLVVMDCLTGNRRGPLNPSSGTTSTVDNQPVDYILTNAILASRDPVAVDTVETAFAGYEQGTIGLLHAARLNGLGTDEPGLIDLAGLDGFGVHRRKIAEFYGPKGRYPFQDKWGEARILKNVLPSLTVNLDDARSDGKGECIFRYAIHSEGEGVPVPVRVELYINGKRAACRNREIGCEGEFRLSLPEECKKPMRYQIVVWDAIFNCTLSEEKRFQP